MDKKDNGIFIHPQNRQPPQPKIYKKEDDGFYGWLIVIAAVVIAVLYALDYIVSLIDHFIN